MMVLFGRCWAKRAICCGQARPQRYLMPSIDLLGQSVRSGDAALAVEVADRFDEGSRGLAFNRGQVRIPVVEDQHDARLVAAIPRLVLDRVVERDAAAFLPDMLLA